MPNLHFKPINYWLLTSSNQWFGNVAISRHSKTQMWHIMTSFRIYFLGLWRRKQCSCSHHSPFCLNEEERIIPSISKLSLHSSSQRPILYSAAGHCRHWSGLVGKVLRLLPELQEMRVLPCKRVSNCVKSFHFQQYNGQDLAKEWAIVLNLSTSSSTIITMDRILQRGEQLC